MLVREPDGRWLGVHSHMSPQRRAAGQPWRSTRQSAVGRPDETGNVTRTRRRVNRVTDPLVPAAPAGTFAATSLSVPARMPCERCANPPMRQDSTVDSRAGAPNTRAGAMERSIRHAPCAKKSVTLLVASRARGNLVLTPAPAGWRGIRAWRPAGRSNQARDTIQRGSNTMRHLPSRLEPGERPLGGQSRRAPWWLS